MHSDLIGKIEKAQRYAQEPERITINGMQAVFHGGNNEHAISLSEGQWTCDCTIFRLHRTCAHIMALQRILAPMLSDDARAELPIGMHSELISMIEKSRRYVHEPERVGVTRLNAQFRGSNNHHTLNLMVDAWACDCESFRMRRTCAHVMALQKLFQPMLSARALAADGPVSEEMIVGALS